MNCVKTLLCSYLILIGFAFGKNPAISNTASSLNITGQTNIYQNLSLNLPESVRSPEVIKANEIPYETANIWTPRAINPEFALPGESFIVEVRTSCSLSTEGWKAELRNDIKSWRADVNVTPGKVFYDAEDGYIFTITIPDTISPELLTLVLSDSKGNFLTSPRCLKILYEFEENFYILHISDEHVMRPEAIHANGSSHPNENYNNGSIDMVNWATEPINIINPRFVIHTGDNVQFWHEYNSTVPLEEGKQNLVNYMNAKNKYTVPTVIVGGNHDTGYQSNYVHFDEWHSHYERVMGARAFSLRMGSFYLITSEWTISEYITYSKEQLFNSYNDSTIKFRLWATHYYDGIGKPNTIPTEKKSVDLGLVGHGHRARTLQSEPFPILMTASGLSGMEHSFYNFTLKEDSIWTCPQINSRTDGVDKFKFFSDWGENPIVEMNFECNNNGTQNHNKVSILNRVRQNFYDGRVRFLMRRGVYDVAGGTVLSQYDYEHDKTAVIVRVDIAPAISDSNPVFTEVNIVKVSDKKSDI